MGATITGTDRILETGARMVALVDALILREGYAIERDMKEQMQGQKSGRVYGKHQASAPGEAPARDSGNLAGSIRTLPMGPHTVTVSIGAEYAAYLEFGTVRMEPRPYVKPAVERSRVRLRALKLDAFAKVNRPTP
jgi:HK97 gp10 family phage protein